jgi:hypothetical protein
MFQNTPIAGPTMECFGNLMLMTSWARTVLLLDRRLHVSEISTCWTDNGMFGNVYGLSSYWTDDVMIQNCPIAGWTDDVMFQNSYIAGWADDVMFENSYIIATDRAYNSN